MKEVFLGLSVLMSLITPFVAVITILKGEYKPQRTTRFVYVMVMSLFVGTLLASDEREGVILALIQFLSCCLIFVLSFRFGMGGKSKWDLLVVILASLTLLVWYTSSNAVLALYFSIATDFIGTSPTLVKSFKKPFTESPIFYLSDVAAASFTLLAISSYTWSSLAFPGYIFGINLLLFSILILRRKLNPQLKS